MAGHLLTYADHVAFYQRQQLLRRRMQFELSGHPVQARSAVQTRAIPVPVAPPAASGVGTRRPPPGAGAERGESATETWRMPVTPPPVDPTVRLRLIVDAGPDSGAVFGLTEGEHVIGRAPDADIRLSDDSVSHPHAKVVVTSRRATIQDLGSLNGTTLGNVSLRGTAILSPGDRVHLSDTELFVATGDVDDGRVRSR
ncbi:MAG: FHA domain-containing protein [Candidatus Nanopelagicales bacterium]